MAPIALEAIDSAVKPVKDAKGAKKNNGIKGWLTKEHK
jgi:hypothetical protein